MSDKEVEGTGEQEETVAVEEPTEKESPDAPNDETVAPDEEPTTAKETSAEVANEEDEPSEEKDTVVASGEKSNKKKRPRKAPAKDTKKKTTEKKKEVKGKGQGKGKKKAAEVVNEDQGEVEADDESAEPKPKKKRTKKEAVEGDKDKPKQTKRKKTAAAEGEAGASPAKKKSKKAATEVDGDDEEATEKKKKSKKADADVMHWTEKDEIQTPEAVGFPGPKYFKIVSWNVNGLRGTLKNSPNVLEELVERERPDVLALQETKIQESHVLDYVNLLDGYSGHWACSTDKLGYAGSVVFTAKAAGSIAPEPIHGKKQAKIGAFFKPKPGTEKAASSKAPVSGGSGLRVLGVRKGLGETEKRHKLQCAKEGRAITVEYEKFFVVSLYVANAGQKLERLDYRVGVWDVALREYVKELEAEGKPVILTGDLNVAHLDIDMYNFGAKHLKRQAGCTDRERGAFDKWLAAPGAFANGETPPPGAMADAFRHFNPTAKGQYTWWSTRSGGKAENQGLRLDYFICSAELLAPPSDDPTKPKVHSVYHDDTSTGSLSDHCPIALILELPSAT